MDAMSVDIPEETMPSDGFIFEDVTSILTEAASDMEPGSFVFMDDLTLHDAMGAFEIGEPRLDSGLIAEGQYRPPFDPTMSLLPEELCWILDRAFSYEMEWHAGNLLCHTVFTLLYVHHLADLDVDFIPSQTNRDLSRPRELVFVVLKAWVVGLLKCCDLAWRELSKGGVQDVEDWQSEKCDVSLLEGIPVQVALSMLEDASSWLMNTTKLSIVWRNALRARILLRKTILQIMDSDVFTNPSQYQDLIDTAREQLAIVRSYHSSEPEPSSPVHHAFDPYIARRLKTFVPVRIVPIPTLQETWRSIDDLLNGWHELSVLAQMHNLSTWEIVGYLGIWSPQQPPRIPYLRSQAQSIFYDGLLILNKFTFTWMIDRFFYETLGVTYDALANTIKQHWLSDALPLPRMERMLFKARQVSPVNLITPHIRGQWLNPPRRRRHLAKSLLDWHSLYDALTEITTSLGDTDIPKDHIVMQMPKVALVWRLSMIREVLFSGFQLELFASEERPIAYWLVAQVLDEHLSCLDDLLHVVPMKSAARREMQFQYQFLTALQSISTAVFVVSMSLISFNWTRLRPTFYRRYKWAFRPEYDDIETQPVGHPDIHRLMPTCADVLQDELFSPSGAIKMAEIILSSLVRSENSGGWAGSWANDRLKFVSSLIDACKGLQRLPGSVKDIEAFDASSLRWDPTVNPWFPAIVTKAG